MSQHDPTPSLHSYIKQHQEPYELNGETVDVVPERQIVDELDMEPFDIARQLYDHPDIDIWVEEADDGPERYYRNNRMN